VKVQDDNKNVKPLATPTDVSTLHSVSGKQIRASSSELSSLHSIPAEDSYESENEGVDDLDSSPDIPSVSSQNYGQVHLLTKIQVGALLTTPVVPELQGSNQRSVYSPTGAYCSPPEWLSCSNYCTLSTANFNIARVLVKALWHQHAAVYWNGKI